MAGTKCLGGTFYIKVNGIQLHAAQGTMTVPLNKTTKTSQAATDGVVGYTSAIRVPFVEASFFRTADFPMDILEADNLTVTVDFTDGAVYNLSDAWVANDADLDGSTGQTQIRFEGKKGDFI